jgi:hypothetical protein
MAFIIKVLDMFKIICNYLDVNSLLALSSVNSETRMLMKKNFQKLFQYKRNIRLPTQCRHCFQDILFKPKYIRHTIAYCSKECFLKYENTNLNYGIAVKSKFQKLFIIPGMLKSDVAPCRCCRSVEVSFFNIGIEK